jgi:hypothetical protein
MSEEINKGEGEIYPEEFRNPEVSFEKRDLSTRAILGFLISLAIAGVLMQVILWGFYKHLAGTYKMARPANPIATSNRQFPIGDPSQVFPAPRLQPDPTADLNKFRAREDEILNSYGWVDQRSGVVRMPIDRAIDVLSQQGLPVRQQGPTTAQQEGTYGANARFGSAPGLGGGNEPESQQ